MNPQMPAEHTPSPSPVGNDLPVMQPGETVIAKISRHPIGLIMVYIGCGLMLVVAAVVVFGIVPSFNNDQLTNIGIAGLLVLVLISMLYSLVATKVYWGNQWVVTSDSLTQINQTGLFTRHSSQLSLGNIEDVSAEQNGILTHFLNYGVIKVETAGEHSKFQFLYCPNPNYYAQQILAAREIFQQGHGGGGHASPGAFAQHPPAPTV